MWIVFIPTIPTLNASPALHMMYYNFVSIHATLRCSPAMAAGVTTKLWELSDLARVLEDWEKRHE